MHLVNIDAMGRMGQILNLFEKQHFQYDAESLLRALDIGFESDHQTLRDYKNTGCLSYSGQFLTITVWESVIWRRTILLCSSAPNEKSMEEASEGWSWNGSGLEQTRKVGT